ncbi:MAG: folate family ECF transporter S component [Sporolactobacillus sp.]
MSIFTTSYWQSAIAELQKVNRLTLAALVIALATVLGSFAIPVSQNLHIVFTFLLFAFGAMVYGPVVGAVAGAAADIVGYIAHPMGAFFPGYTLSAILSGLIYGLLLYRTRITVLRLVLVKLTINYAINVGLGCLWSALLFGKAYYFFFAASLLKNTLMLPIEVVLLYVTLQVLLPVLGSAHLLPKSARQTRIPLF